MSPLALSPLKSMTGYQSVSGAPLNVYQVVIETDRNADDGRLFAVESVTLSEQQRSRRTTVEKKADYIIQTVNSSDAAWLIWCDLNAESSYLARSIPDAVEVKGSDSDEWKEQAMIGFADGTYRVLVTKPSIAGFGMNWQHCSHMAFCGMSNSYEQFYQAVRRCWRFGQTEPVEVMVTITDQETAIFRNVMDKREASSNMHDQMIRRSRRIRDDASMTERDEMPYIEEDAHGESWDLLLGDCVTRVREIPDKFVGYTIFSPPFASLYTYSNSNRDMGNSKSINSSALSFPYTPTLTSIHDYWKNHSFD